MGCQGGTHTVWSKKGRTACARIRIDYTGRKILQLCTFLRTGFHRVKQQQKIKAFREKKRKYKQNDGPFVETLSKIDTNACFIL